MDSFQNSARLIKRSELCLVQETPVTFLNAGESLMFCAIMRFLFSHRPAGSGVSINDTVPQGISDIGRRVAQCDGDHSGWDVIGIVAGFIPLHDRRLGDAAKFGIGEDMASLFAAGALDYWVILYGSGHHEYCDAVGVIKVRRIPRQRHLARFMYLLIGLKAIQETCIK